ncbi:MAG: hypothetical protein ACLU6Y_13820 [Ruminococcus sp.]
MDEVQCDFITGQSISLFQDNKAKKTAAGGCISETGCQRRRIQRC